MREGNLPCHLLLVACGVPKLSLKKQTKIESQEQTWEPPSFDRSWMSHMSVLPQHLDKEVFVGCLSLSH